MRDRVLLLGHGTVEDLDDLPPFLTNIRRGRPSPPELLREIRRRYEIIGGSPLLRLSRDLAAAVEERLGTPVHLATRFWHPFAKDVLRDLAKEGCRSLRMVPLAPYSGPVYAGELQKLAAELRAEGLELPPIACAPNWGLEPALVQGFAAEIERALMALPGERRAAAEVFFTAHSLPLAVLRQGDPYASEVEKTAAAVGARAGLGGRFRVVYQSQGATADPWLGPDVRESLARAAAEGVRDVVFCPIGFLSDHIEVLYDLDVEARDQARDLGVAYARTASLNAAAPLVDAIAAVAAALV